MQRAEIRLCSLIKVFVVLMKKRLHPWLSIMCLDKILIRLYAQTNLNLQWGHVRFRTLRLILFLLEHAVNMITFHLENNHMSWTDIMQEIADRYSGNQFPTISTLNSFSTANYILFKISLSEQRRAKVCLRNLCGYWILQNILVYNKGPYHASRL